MPQYLRMKTKRTASAGFTLLELAAVFFLMALLGGAAIHDFGKVMAAGSAVACLSFVLAAFGASRKWPGFPEVPVVAGLLLGLAVSAFILNNLMNDPNNRHFSRIMRRSNEGAGRGNLNAIRAALDGYRQDSKDGFPTDLSILTLDKKYLSAIPSAKTPPYHPDSSAVRNGNAPQDSGGWFYINARGEAQAGKVFVDCTHTDSKASLWTTY